MKIYRVATDDGCEEKFFTDEQKATEYGLTLLDEVNHAEWERRDICDIYGVDSWEEARKLAIDDGEDCVWFRRIEVIDY